ncbi:bZIP transcription factor [Rhodotorula toruloides]|uniref:BZIP transcription factor n=1 Tax=Rhodotorula toruloides TaxID=5286 RepID=A0A511K7Z2_RHOTO|nr:bZIP transcription factor [Rhodotorula toruloides]GEM06130.1 bZIP transcription factor [Rhodotorula toruloides]
MESPATICSRRRTSSPPLSPASLADDDTARPPAKKRAPRSTAAEKHARKQARMERNRIAAQVSRDRKKQHTDYLEARVAELEAQLASQSPSTSLATTPPRVNLPLVALPALPATADPVVAQLREENESLKTQLALEQLQSQSLQIRLSSLETKFGRLERLLSQAATSNTRGRPFPAAEAVPPVVPSGLSYIGLDFTGHDELALPLDSFNTATDALGDSLVDSDPAVDSAPLFDGNEVIAAWADWSQTLDGYGQATAPPLADEPAADFDFFAFLRQDAAAGAAAEIAC